MRMQRRFRNALWLAVLNGLAQMEFGCCQYGSPCTTAANCTDPSAPHCSIYFTDATGAANTRSYTDSTPQPTNLDVRGICVECKTDCDCGINRYCGLGEWTIPQTVSQNSGTAGASSDAGYKTIIKSIQLYGIAYLNMRIKSRCRDYSMPSGFCSVHYGTPSATIVEQKNADGSTVPILRIANSNLTTSVQGAPRTSRIAQPHLRCPRAPALPRRETKRGEDSAAAPRRAGPSPRAASISRSTQHCGERIAAPPVPAAPAGARRWAPPPHARHGELRHGEFRAAAQREMARDDARWREVERDRSRHSLAKRWRGCAAALALAAAAAAGASAAAFAAAAAAALLLPLCCCFAPAAVATAAAATATATWVLS